MTRQEETFHHLDGSGVPAILGREHLCHYVCAAEPQERAIPGQRNRRKSTSGGIESCWATLYHQVVRAPHRQQQECLLTERRDRLRDVGENKFDSNTTFVRLVYSTRS